MLCMREVTGELKQLCSAEGFYFILFYFILFYFILFYLTTCSAEVEAARNRQN
jgi:hypothetical protein